MRFSRGGSGSGEHGTFAVTNPVNGNVLAECADMGPGDVANAIAEAAAAAPEWAATPAKERAALLMQWSDAVWSEKEYLAQLMYVS